MTGSVAVPWVAGKAQDLLLVLLTSWGVSFLLGSAFGHLFLARGGVKGQLQGPPPLLGDDTKPIRRACSNQNPLL